MSPSLEEPDYRAAMDAALHLLKFRRRTEKELADRLRRKKIAAELVDHVISRLRELALVDDAALARDWVVARRRSGQGEGRVKQDLRRRGVPPDLLAEILLSLPLESGDEVARAEAALKRRAPRVAGLERGVQYRRLTGFLGRQGFSPDAIQSALRRHFAAPEDSGFL